MSLIYPMFAMFLLTASVLVVMFVSRVRAIKRKEVSIGYFRTYREADLPDSVVKSARHFSNLFEAPVLFYVACLAAMIINVTSPLVVILAWVYFATRLLHAIIHIGKNDVIWRMRAYALSWVTLVALWVLIVLSVS